VSKVRPGEGERATNIEEARKLTDRLLTTVKSQKPTNTELAELRKALEETPALVSTLGDLSVQLKFKIIEAMANQPGRQLVIGKQVEKMAEELGGGDASPLERMLIDQVMIAWLRWQSVEWAYQYGFAQGQTLTKGLYLEKRLSAAHRRYLQSIESLARVRRLLARVGVQVNIAQQQVVRNG